MNAIHVAGYEFSRTSSISTLVMKGNNILGNQDSNSKKTLFKQWIFWAVISYLLFIVLYIGAFVASEGENVLLSANELGDFLAGSFAPLAFLFLYLGYKIQGEELKQNTKALEKQAEELANSVAEQKRLIAIHQEEKEARDFSVQPNFNFRTSSLNFYVKHHDITDEEGSFIEWVEEECCEFNVFLKNNGEVAKQLYFRCENSAYKSIYEMHKNDEETILISLSEDEIKVLREQKNFTKDFSMKYYGSFGKEYLVQGKFEVSFLDEEHDYYVLTRILKN